MSEKNNIILSSFFEWLHIPASEQKGFLFRLAAFWVLMVFVMVIDPNGFSPDVIEGQPAPRTIRCPRLISFVDEQKTKELRNLEMEKVPPVYTSIENAEVQMFDRFNRFTSSLKNYYQELCELSPVESPKTIIASYFPSESLLDSEQLIQLKNFKPDQIDRLISVSRHILGNISQKIITPKNLEVIKAEVKNMVEAYPEGASFKLLMICLIRNSLLVNAIENEKLTRERKEAAARSIQPVKRSFQKGQKIIDEGAIVSSDDYYVIKKITKQLQKNKVLSFLGNSLMVLLVLVTSLVYLRLESPNFLKDQVQLRLLGVLCLITVAFAKVVHCVTVSFDKQPLAVLLTPLPTMALLMTMLLNSTVALFHVVLTGMLMFIIGEANVKFVVVSLFGAITALLTWRSATRTSDVRNIIGLSGLKIGIASSISMFAFILLDTDSFSAMNVEEIFMVSGFGLMNGIFSGILANGVLPYIERMFSLATTSRLLELADLSQPLLKKLAEEAPGTYQHSIAVATLAEAAANAINADPLLTKIAAYFHDIGKLKRPMYFSENQSDENRHDQVTPYMSSLILIGHIRDSLDLGREYGLPERVLSIMSQHHGTTLISYFFEEAKRNKDGEEVNEERFRYPGPKPQTKEAAILMLADSVEAAARTLPQYTHNKIESLVRKIIQYKLNDENQLDESDLTLKDIEKIEQVFVRTISSMYHSRIDYPGKLSNQPKGATDGSSDQ